MSLGAAALGLLEGQAGFELVQSASAAASDPSAARVHPPLAGLPHHAPKAKSVIYIHTNGGPSQIDLWDYKPGLHKFFDQPIPPSVQGGQRLSTMTS
ncbi:MAG: DUF1501 domain-containing protein, partial [Planctomycetota bacterium]